jgi:hypothetical protein
MEDVFKDVVDNTNFKFKKFGIPNDKDVFGDKFRLQDFLECVEDSGIMDDDGMIGEVLVGGELTDIYIPGWGFDNEVKMDFDDLSALEEEVIIVWYNK